MPLRASTFSSSPPHAHSLAQSVFQCVATLRTLRKKLFVWVISGTSGAPFSYGLPIIRTNIRCGCRSWMEV